LADPLLDLEHDKYFKEGTQMSKSARSVFVFGLYCAVLGIILIAVPNLLLKAISRPSTTEVWIRVAGMFLIHLGFYYTQTARKEMTSFFRLTVYTRSIVISFLPLLCWLDLQDHP